MSSNRLRRPAKAKPTRDIEFDDNALLPPLFGEHDQNILRIEQQLGVVVASRGNHLQISGPEDSSAIAADVLEALYERLSRGLEVGDADVDAAVRLARQSGGGKAELVYSKETEIVTRKRRLSPRSPGQAAYVRAMRGHELVFGIGPAGTGKTYLAVAIAVSQLVEGKVERIILSRPAVEAGERLGFLPGDMMEKVDPYLRPLYDALYDMLPADHVASRLSSGEIEIAPLAFMRGRTLSNAFIILDEAQNTTPVQMKMFLTRMGENSQMVVTGDLSQIDLPPGHPSGLRDAVDILAKMDEVAFVQFTSADVVRHSLVTKIVQAYDAADSGGNEEADLFPRG